MRTESLDTLIDDGKRKPLKQLVDVTARKRAESEREDAARLLAQRAAEQEAIAWCSASGRSARLSPRT